MQQFEFSAIAFNQAKLLKGYFGWQIETHRLKYII
jgi:hypothetical protein